MIKTTTPLGLAPALEVAIGVHARVLADHGVARRDAADLAAEVFLAGMQYVLHALENGGAEHEPDRQSFDAPLDAQAPEREET